MATPSQARAVKSLNKSPGRRRFIFKTIAQRIEEIDIDVYRSLVTQKAEPSEGSSFFRDCLIEYRELNTAEDFISLYEEIFPLVQTLPQIILQKDIIILGLLSRLKMEGRLSLEPILRLIAALSRDLLGDFIPFLPRFAASVEQLLLSGAERDPEIIEQIFVSWSYMIMYLLKYLVKDVDHVLSITAKLRYYPKNHVREFMAESLSFLLRKTTTQQLKQGMVKLMTEVAKESSEMRISGAAALISHVLRFSSSKLHSKADTLIPLLLDSSSFLVGDESQEGSTAILEVLILVFRPLYVELDPIELAFMWKCLCGKITDSVIRGDSKHVICLLSLLISILKDNSVKFSGIENILDLVDMLVKTFSIEFMDIHSDIIDKILKLMTCIIDPLSKDMPVLQRVSSKWEFIFYLTSPSLLAFIGELLTKDRTIFPLFGRQITIAFDNLIQVFNEEVLHLMISFCEKLEGKNSNFVDSDKLSRLHSFFEETLAYWIKKIPEVGKGNLLPDPFQENDLAVLWGVVRCFPHFSEAHTSPSILIDLIDAIEELLLVDSCFPKNPWHSLIGAALRSYHKLMCSRKLSHGDSAITKFLDLAERYKSSPQILSAVADILDEVSLSMNGQSYLPEYAAERALVAFEMFDENLFHANKETRLSALRILCHYEPLFHKEVDKDNILMDVTEASHIGQQPHNNVFKLLREIEETDLSISTSREAMNKISRIQMSLSAHTIADRYLPAILSWLVGTFHNRFSYLWNATLECLTVLISQHDKIVWAQYFKCLDHSQAVFLSYDQPGGEENNHKKDTGLICQFISDHSPQFDSTPSATVLSSLIQCLQKVPLIAESHTRQIIPLFLKFLGYKEDTMESDAVAHSQSHKGKAWKGVTKEWLSLFRLLRNPKSFYQGQVFRNILLYRLLDQNDADVQMKVLDCLLNWRDDYLVPYAENMKNLINTEYVRDELTKWSLSKNSIHSIDALHRTYVIPIVIRLLIPKVRNLKMLACQKSSRLNHRRAVLRFLAQLEVDELSLLFWLLIKPLLSTSEREDETIHGLWSAHQIQDDDINTSAILKLFTIDAIKSVSLKSKYGFLHVIEEIVAVFDESRLIPFLDLLMNCVVRILASCTSSVSSIGRGESSADPNHSGFDLDGPSHDEVQGLTMEAKAVKQFKDLRSLCLKITYLVLTKYENHDLGSAFWDLFFSSVKPLIANFKQEGGASKNPSSLFCCFLAMSKSYELVPLLDREGNLVADIFSILTIPSASESIISGVLKFIKNLLKLDSEIASQDTSLKRILLPNLDVLLSSLRTYYSSEIAAKRQSKVPGKKELTIFNFLSKYIVEPSAAEQFLDILLPHLQKIQQNPDTCVNVLQIIRQVVTVLGDASSRRILCAITPLLISAGLAARVSICQILDAVAASDSSLLIVAKVLRDLNATSEMEMGGSDFEKILGAYDMVNVTFFYTLSEEHALPILAHCIHDLSSEELILRQSAFRLLVSFIDFLGEILQESTLNKVWSEVSVRRVVNNIFLKYMGNAMEKEGAVRKVWLDLLKEMVLKIPTLANLGSYKALCSDDAEQDFFNNIVHLQKHRRARAVSRFRNMVDSGNLSEAITNKVFVPLLFSMLFGAHDGKDEHIRSACIDALASISGHMKWNRYYALLLRCFRDLTLKADKQKILLRLISSILDHFHFSESLLVHGAEVTKSDALGPKSLAISSSFSLRRCAGSTELPAAQMSVHKNLLPKIQKLLTSDSDNVNVNISLVALKLLKLLPGEIMDSQLPTIIHRISNFLRHRLESVREEARSALTACLKELGLEYLQFILKTMKASLKRGFELHVLGYTLNFMLSKLLVNPIRGQLDYCIGDLLSVVENDILGEVSEEKEVDKIASKMKETRKQKSYETLKLIAQSITFKNHALKLLCPVTGHLHKELTQKVKSKVEKMLDHIAEGIQCNPSVNQTELFIFVHCLIKDGIADEGQEHENSHVSRGSRFDLDDEDIHKIHSNRLLNLDRRFSHLITTFALGLFQNYLNKLKLSREDKQLISLLDPFVSLLVQCLSSKYENIVSAGLKCLSLLVRLPLPSLQSQSDKIKNTLLVIAQGSVNVQSELMESCMKLLTTLLRSSRVTLSVDQLHMLIQFPMFVDLAKSPSFIALKLLKAIVHRKLVVPEIYDIVQIIAELMVQSQSEPIRKKSSQILLQFLLGYNISEKRLQQHLDFLLANLRYEHSTGREAVLEMLHAIIQKFPINIIDAQSQMIFVHLVASLANDADNKVRSMTAAAIKCLIGHVTSHSLHSILEFTLSWYVCARKNLCAPSAQSLIDCHVKIASLGYLVDAGIPDMKSPMFYRYFLLYKMLYWYQVLGLLAEVMGKSFGKHLSKVLPVMRGILQSAATSLSSSEQTFSDDAVPFWKEAYYSLVMLEKIVNQFHNLIFDRDHEDIWETLCGFLLHPHLWLRNISNRMLSLYFAAVTEACGQNPKLSMENFVLMKPSTLFLSAVSFCCQLKVSLTDDKPGNIIWQNLVFSICSLNSLLQNNGTVEVSKFWSSLDSTEQTRFHKAFHVLDQRKGRRMLVSFTSDTNSQHIQHQHPFISYLLQRMGKLAFQMEANQMKIIFKCFKSISPQVLGAYSSTDSEDLLHDYAYQMLSPLYKVSEGFTGKVISDDLKQEAQEVSESIRDIIGVQRFVQIYNQIRKTLQVKRDKRKQEHKVMAVVNPTRHAKRKLRLAAKHQAHKKRKIMTMRMGKWMH